MEQGIYSELSLARPPPTKPSPDFMLVTKPSPGIDTITNQRLRFHIISSFGFIYATKALALILSQYQAVALNMHTMSIGCNEMNDFVTVHHWSITVSYSHLRRNAKHLAAKIGSLIDPCFWLAGPWCSPNSSAAFVIICRRWKPVVM
jgi:hypothetical protein